MHNEVHMRSPVLFLIFNRPKETKHVFAAIRKARPPRLYVAADGPRANHPEDITLCKETRSIIEYVDWDCKVYTFFRDKNVRGPKGIPEAVGWFFSNENEGIILEDDTLPNSDFFKFCGCLLERYRNNEKIMHISGGNFQLGLRHGVCSYYFSRMPHAWGWATWARAWAKFQPYQEFDDIVNFFKDHISKICPSGNFGSLVNLMGRCVNGQEGHWDARWFYSVMTGNGLTITPNVPLAQHIGYGSTATHAKSLSLFNMLAPQPLGEIIHPQNIEWNQYADIVDYRLCFNALASSLSGLKKEIMLRIEEKVSREAIEFTMRLKAKFENRTKNL